ncbi:uncharacterized protein LOC114190407 isoform X2 [Vigna unguiculata]|nr:uncharacterized protein LOC114190407 isoform X2 [Vigna unguiculata]
MEDVEWRRLADTFTYSTLKLGEALYDGKSDRNSRKSTRVIAGLIHTFHLLALNKNAYRQQCVHDESKISGYRPILETMFLIGRSSFQK